MRCCVGAPNALSQLKAEREHRDRSERGERHADPERRPERTCLLRHRECHPAGECHEHG
jgi:hypothetical protein